MILNLKFVWNLGFVIWDLQYTGCSPSTGPILSGVEMLRTGSDPTVFSNHLLYNPFQRFLKYF